MPSARGGHKEIADRKHNHLMNKSYWATWRICSLGRALWLHRAGAPSKPNGHGEFGSARWPRRVRGNPITATLAAVSCLLDQFAKRRLGWNLKCLEKIDHTLEAIASAPCQTEETIQRENSSYAGGELMERRAASVPSGSAMNFVIVVSLGSFLDRLAAGLSSMILILMGTAQRVPAIASGRPAHLARPC